MGVTRPSPTYTSKKVKTKLGAGALATLRGQWLVGACDELLRLLLLGGER